LVVGCWFLAGLRGTIFRINPPITNNQRPTTVYPQSLDNVPVWDDRTWRTLAPLDSDLSTEVCVIGLGGSGLTAVSELLDLGRRVVGIDADDVAAGAAGRNGGFLLGGTVDFHHDAVAAIGRARALRLHELTLEEIHRIAGQAPGTVRFPGSLRIAGSDEEFTDCARQRDAMRADGIPVEDYAGQFGRGLFFPGDATFNPLARDCRGGRPPGVAGAGTGGHRAHRAAPDACHGADPRDRHSVPGVRPLRIRLLPAAPDGSVALGGGRDKASDEEWTTANEPTAFVQQYLESVLREQLDVTAPITHRWAANVSYTLNGLPVLAELRPGTWVIGGYCGTGNAVGALCGRAAARLASGDSSEFARLLVNAGTPETH